MMNDKSETMPAVSLKYDKDINIATASSREAKTWKNKQNKLSKLVAKLSHTTRTSESYQQFLALPKKEQDDIKDVGGFVGGMLKGGRRSKHDVANRQVMTLDADYGDDEFLDRVREILGAYSWTIYSTHKHSTKSPRLRLLVYPDRPMLGDEYQAAMRMIAFKVGIDYFDDTTYDVNRLMYWPSTSLDGDWVFEHNDKPFIEVDEVLGWYGGEDWQDVTNWPVSSREERKKTRHIDRQADPLTKKGIVGAFCRQVGLRSVLDDHLKGIYKREKTDRYTYIDGTSSNGLVIYDDKFAYSNHSTDPASGQTCNAFDLLRIHKFGHLDDDCRESTPTHKLPSFAAMVDFAKTFKTVKADLVQSGLEDVNDLFDDLDGDAADDQDAAEWFSTLQITDKGEIKPTFLNATIIVRNDPKIMDLMGFNELEMKVERIESGEMWSAPDSYKVRKYVGSRYSVDFPEAKIEQAIEDRAYANRFHPIRDYLESLEWDGVDRVSGLFVDWCKAEDNAYTREAAMCWMVAAVSRVYEPGFKFDYTPVLGGAQGIGKTSIINLLARGWYGELTSFDDKLAMESMLGRWVMEINEMGATNKHELEVQKSFLSATETTVRMAYARHPVRFKRQCVFMGTTNQREYLKDSTGNRRWWPIDCRVKEGDMIDLNGFGQVVDQLWAEAHALYMAGQTVLLSREASAIAKGLQEDKRESDEWEGIILAWLETDAADDRYERDSFGADLIERTKVCIAEIWADCLQQKGQPKMIDKRRIGSIMDNAPGWERHKTITFGKRFGRQRGWLKDCPF